MRRVTLFCIFFFQAEDGIRDVAVTGVQTCALPIYAESEPEPQRIVARSEVVCESCGPVPPASACRPAPARRSEEHTSELQSRLHLVCRLLLEKKKQHDTPRRRHTGSSIRFRSQRFI